MGLRPRQAAEFRFILGLPTLGAACVYSLAKDVMRDGGVNMFEALGAMPLVAGLVVATLSAVVAVRWLVSFLTRHACHHHRSPPRPRRPSASRSRQPLVESR